MLHAGLSYQYTGRSLESGACRTVIDYVGIYIYILSLDPTKRVDFP